MAVASEVPAVTVTSGERPDSGWPERRCSTPSAAIAAVVIILIFVNGRLLGWAERESLCDDPPLERGLRCDVIKSPIGLTRRVRYPPHAWRGAG